MCVCVFFNGWSFPESEKNRVMFVVFWISHLFHGDYVFWYGRTIRTAAQSSIDRGGEWVSLFNFSFDIAMLIMPFE